MQRFFAAESENLEENAELKLKSKNADFIVANNIVEKNSGFSYDTNKVTIIDKNGDKIKLPLMHKLRLANKILDKIKITKKMERNETILERKEKGFDLIVENDEGETFSVGGVRETKRGIEALAKLLAMTLEEQLKVYKA